MSSILKGIQLNEVNPHNYDSDWDYQDAVANSGRSRSRSSDNYDAHDAENDAYEMHKRFAATRARKEAEAKAAAEKAKTSEQDVAEGEQEYGPKWDEKVKRLGQMAKEGPRKTVWDPVKRVYKTVPVNAPKKEFDNDAKGITEADEWEEETGKHQRFVEYAKKTLMRERDPKRRIETANYLSKQENKFFGSPISSATEQMPFGTVNAGKAFTDLIKGIMLDIQDGRLHYEQDALNAAIWLEPEGKEFLQNAHADFINMMDHSRKEREQHAIALSGYQTKNLGGKVMGAPLKGGIVNDASARMTPEIFGVFELAEQEILRKKGEREDEQERQRNIAIWNALPGPLKLAAAAAVGKTPDQLEKILFAKSEIEAVAGLDASDFPKLAGSAKPTNNSVAEGMDGTEYTPKVGDEVLWRHSDPKSKMMPMPGTVLAVAPGKVKLKIYSKRMIQDRGTDTVVLDLNHYTVDPKQGVAEGYDEWNARELEKSRTRHPDGTGSTPSKTLAKLMRIPGFSKVSPAEQQRVAKAVDRYLARDMSFDQALVLAQKQGVAEGLSEMDNRTPSGDREEQRRNRPEAKAKQDKEQQKRLKDTSPEMRKKLRLSEPKQGVAEEKPGLWANIHAKQNRIKHGSGEHMRTPGSKGAPTADALRKSAVKESSILEGLQQVDEINWKHAAAAGAMALGALGGGHAQAADLSGYNTQYLQQIVSGQAGRPMVSVDDAKQELQARMNGKEQSVSAPAQAQEPKGFSMEYLQKASDPNRLGRYLISVEKAQELLNQAQGK